MIKTSWELTEAEKGYLAGFLDGEGSIVISKGGQFVRPAICFYNSHLETMDWIADKLGQIRYTRSSDPRRDKRHTKTNYAIMVRTASDIITLLKLLLPYLRIKKNQARLMLRFMDTYVLLKYKSVEWKKEIYEKFRKEMSELNHGGDYDFLG